MLARETLDGQHDKKAGRLKQNKFCFPRPTAGEVNGGPAGSAGQFGETKVLTLNLKLTRKRLPNNKIGSLFCMLVLHDQPPEKIGDWSCWAYGSALRRSSCFECLHSKEEGAHPLSALYPSLWYYYIHKPDIVKRKG